MKITTTEEAKRFEEVINNCRNTVYLVTNRGEQFDLKTSSGWYKGMAELMNVEDSYSEPEIFANSDEDESRIARFIITDTNLYKVA